MPVDFYLFSGVQKSCLATLILQALTVLPAWADKGAELEGESLISQLLGCGEKGMKEGEAHGMKVLSAVRQRSRGGVWLGTS